MVSAIGSIAASYSVSSVQPLTPETKAQLESMGIDTSSIKTESEGQTYLQSAQTSQSSQQSQNSQQGQQFGGNHAGMQAVREQAMALAEKVGASVPSGAKLSEIMDAISQSISSMQAQAANNPEQAAKVAQYQSEYISLSNAITSMQASMQASQGQTSSGQLQASMNALAMYNMASITMAESASGSGSGGNTLKQ
jgi:hypothetical protein